MSKITKTIINREAKRKLKALENKGTIPLTPLSPIQEVSQSHNCQPVWTYSKVLYWIWTATKWLVGNALALLGAIALFFELSPKISVSPDQLLDPSEPFSAPFIVSNESYLPLQSVAAHCFGNVAMDNYIDFKPMRVVDRIDIAQEMLPGEKLTVKCAFREGIKMSAAVKSADIQISIEYRQWPLTRHREFRFVSARGSDNAWHWHPQPIHKLPKMDKSPND